MAKIINTFNQGVDRDSSKNKYDNLHYYDAKNVRIFSQDGLSSGALENIDGNYLRIQAGAAGTVVGSVILGDFLVLWVTTNTTSVPNGSSSDTIHKIPISELDALTGGGTIVLNPFYYHLGAGYKVYSGNLWLCKGNPVKAVARYETSSIQKVYWVDGYNNLRYINTVYNSESNDLTSITEDKLEVIGDITLTAPQLYEMVSGNLTAGKVQYIYQLYNVNGSETVYSPASSLIHLTNYSESLSKSSDYFGSYLEENTGKGIKCSVTIGSSGYKKIRVVAVHYSTLNGDPTVRIVEEKDITGSAGEVVYFTDTGGTIENLLLENIRVLGTYLFVPQDIDIKDNILFPANITENSFDVDFDARAYRFGGESPFSANRNYNSEVTRNRYCRMYEENTNLYKIYGGTKATTYETAGGNVIETLTDWTEIPETADCMNPFNDLDNDGDHNQRYMYQSDGETIGGEGPNVSYEFKIKQQQIQSNNFTQELYSDIEGSTSNPSFYSYASPYIADRYLGYQRDETYRFGIIFFDSRGRSSFVKWIGDIRFPSMSTLNKVGDVTYGSSYDFNILYHNPATSITYMNILYIEFTLDLTDAIADGAVAYQIVRVRRGADDRSVQAQGMLANVSSTGSDIYHPNWIYAGVAGTGDYMTFQSPEIAFNKELVLRSNDKMQNILQTPVYSDTTYLNAYVYKYKDWATMNNPQYQYDHGSISAGDEFYPDEQTDIDDGFILRQDEIEREIGAYNFTINDAVTHKDKGISFVFKCDNSSWTSRLNLNDVRRLVNYRRNVYNVQYGGISYSARSRNNYMVAGPVTSTATTTVSVYGGDTYISYFDYLCSSWEDGVSAVIHPEIIYFPCETSINLDLRMDRCFSKDDNLNKYLIHDTAGVWGDDTPPVNEYTQETDLYLYNNTYSKENDTKLFVPRPAQWNESEYFPTRILASQLKTNNELTDSWLKYPANQSIDVDPQYGVLTAVKTVTQQLLYFQPRGFGVVAVNERALLQTESLAQLSLGVSGVLERFDYSKTGVGCSDKKHLVLTPNALYWADIINEAIFKFSTGIEELSAMKGLDAWFRSNLKGITVGNLILYYDPQYREVYITDHNAGWTWMYNEVTDSFICRTDFHPTFVINYNDTVMSTIDGINFYRHNDDSAERAEFYGTQYDSSITLLINPSNENVHTFNNMEWLTEVTNAGTGADLQETFDTVKFWNDYQSTGSTALSLTVNSNIRRRMRKWRYVIPRATRKGDHTTLLDRRDSRFRDSHLFVELSFDNENGGGIDRKLIIHDIITSFIESNK